MEHEEANQRAIESVSAMNRAQPKTSLESAETTIFYRPVGPKELELIASSGYREFPSRLPEQPTLTDSLTH